jgi:flagellar protein FlbT
MNITLRAGERIYINGAVLRTDRKATIELLNDATFLLETHVMQASDATTPLRQIYFVIQVMLMDPAAAKATTQLARGLIEKANDAFESPEIKAGLRAITDMIARARYFEAMKSLRAMYALEQREMFPIAESAPSHAA